MKSTKSKWISAIVVVIIMAAVIIGITDENGEFSELYIRSFSNGTGYASSIDPAAQELQKDVLWKYDCEGEFQIEKVYRKEPLQGNYYISPDNKEIYYAGFNEVESGIWKIDIENQTEQKVFDKPVMNVLFVGDTLYASSLETQDSEDVKLYSSTTGEDWELCGTLGEEKADDMMVTAMAKFDGRLYAATAYALYSSEDEGKTWKPIYKEQEITSSLLYMNDKMYFTIAEKGGFRMLGEGGTFLTLDFEIDGKPASRFWPDSDLEKVGDSLWAATATEDKSTDKWAFVWNSETEKLEGSVQIESDEVLMGAVDGELYLYDVKKRDFRTVEY